VEEYKALYRNIELKRDLRFARQITRAAVSIPSNIAEGDELNTVKQGINHLYIAKGSCAELITQLQIAYEIGRLNKSSYQALNEKAKKVSATLYKVIEARKKWTSRNRKS